MVHTGSRDRLSSSLCDCMKSLPLRRQMIRMAYELNTTNKQSTSPVTVVILGHLRPAFQREPTYIFPADLCALSVKN